MQILWNLIFTKPKKLQKISLTTQEFFVDESNGNHFRNHFWTIFEITAAHEYRVQMGQNHEQPTGGRSSCDTVPF